MLPLIAAPLAAAGISALSSAGQAYAQGRMNKKTRKWNEKMYDVQRKDSLFDYNSQNTYNSPEEQMKRLKMAGLNPNLVYDNGAATAQAAPIRSTDVKSWNPETPQVDAGSAVSAYYDTAQQVSQTDNLQKQLDLMEEQRLLLISQRGKTDSENKLVLQNVDSSAFKLKMDKYLEQNSYDMASGSLEALKANIGKTKADTAYTLTQDQIQTAMKASTVKQAALNVLETIARTKNIKTTTREIEARITNLGLDKTFKELQNQALKEGKNINDPWVFKQLQGVLDRTGIGQIFHGIGTGVGDAIKSTNKNISEKYRNWKNGKGWQNNR